ncbi:TPA: hypothetical protein O6E57_002707 [Staphylococcus aureus]|nr:hypothetical protein [Staphylococcus aureus]HDB1618736.1 hypothetical protein [Staphylococcus aureus]
MVAYASHLSFLLFSNKKVLKINAYTGTDMAKLDLNSLDDEHVKLLINELKYPETRIDVNELKTIVASRINERQEIISFKLGIKYLLTIKRGNIEKDRFSISIIFKDTYHTLVRIDINGGTHDNPDGTIAPKSHIHIYNDKYDKKDRFAYEINLKDFPDIYNLYNVYMSFLEYNNIKDLE